MGIVRVVECRHTRVLASVHSYFIFMNVLSLMIHLDNSESMQLSVCVFM